MKSKMVRTFAAVLFVMVAASAVASAQTRSCVDAFRSATKVVTDRSGRKLKLAVETANFDPVRNLAKLNATFDRLTQTIASVTAVSAQEARYENTVRPLVAAFASFQMYEDLAPTVGLLQNFEGTTEHKASIELEERSSELKTQAHAMVYNSTALYSRFKAVLANEALTSDRKIIVRKMIGAFEAAGVGLDPATTAKIDTIRKRLADVSSRFRKNYSARLATKIYLPLETKFSSRAPRARIEAARAAGEGRSLVFTLAPDDVNQTHFLLQFAEDSEVRRTFYKKFTSAFRGPLSNRQLIAETVNLRTELAKLLGSDHFAGTVLPTQMIGTPEALFEFTDSLQQPYVELVKSELGELEALKGARLQPWDVQYFAKIKELNDLGGKSIEDASPFLEFHRSIAIVMKLVGDFYLIDFKQTNKVATWHADVLAYEAFDRRDGRKLGLMFLDLLARPEKPKGGAFMANFVPPGELMDFDGGYTRALPIAVANASIPKPGSGPVLIPFRNLQSAIHEIGHGVHALTYTGEAPIYSGVFGHATIMDFVELPSQLLENFMYAREFLKVVGRHFQTGEPLSDEFISSVILQQRAQTPGLKTLGRRGLMTRHDYQLHTLSSFDPSSSVAGYLAKQNPEWREFAYLLAVTRIENNPYLFMHDYQVKFHGYQYSEANEATVFNMAMANGLARASETGVRFRDEILSRGSLGDENGDMAALFQKFTGGPTDARNILKKYQAPK